MRVWCLVLLLVLWLSPRAWADTGQDRLSSLCDKAATAEREAKEAIRKSEERQRFLKWKGALPPVNTPSSDGNAAAIRQSIKSRIAEIRAILPQLRQVAAAADHDRGLVPGLGQYFVQVESTISRLLQSVDACLDIPEYCNLPVISCPSPPPIPTFKNVASADLLRNVQQSYAQHARMAQHACLNLNNGISGEMKRLKDEKRAVAMHGGTKNTQSEEFGEADLQLRRAERLKREALQYRQEADRVSGVSGYCGVRSRPKMSPEKSRAVVAALKAAGRRERKAAPGIPLDGKVVDLKAGWEQPWEKGNALVASNVPLPKVSVRENGKDTFRLKGMAKDGYEMAASWYREADGQVELTEFLQPPSSKEFLEDKMQEAAKEALVAISGKYEKSVEAGIKILEAVKGTTEEIGEILEDAPRVIGSGSAADAQELADRANRVPVKFLNSLFDGITGEIDLPEYRYQSKNGGERK